MSFTYYARHHIEVCCAGSCGEGRHLFESYSGDSFCGRMEVTVGPDYPRWWLDQMGFPSGRPPEGVVSVTLFEADAEWGYPLLEAAHHTWPLRFLTVADLAMEKRDVLARYLEETGYFGAAA